MRTNLPLAGSTCGRLRGREREDRRGFELYIYVYSYVYAYVYTQTESEKSERGTNRANERARNVQQAQPGECI